MRQYKVTSQDILPDTPEDCFLAPEDPIHNLKPAAMLGGLGGQEALANYNNSLLPKIEVNDKGRIQREQNIKPGTEEWFKHWFGRKA